MIHVSHTEWGLSVSTIFNLILALEKSLKNDG